MERIQTILCILILMLIINSMPRVKAQHNMEHLTKLSESAEEVISINPSPDGRWAAYVTNYESRPSTLTIVETKSPFKKIMREKVSKYYFVNNHTIVVLSGHVMNLINLESGTVKEIRDVNKIDFAKRNNLLLVHFNSVQNNRLEIYDHSLKIVQTVENVNRWDIGKEDIIVLSKDEKKEKLSRIYQLKDNGKKRVELWSTENEVFTMGESKSGLGGFVVSARSNSGLRFFYIKEGVSPIELSDQSMQGFTYTEVYPSSDKDAIYLRIQKVKSENNSIVDIWYGNEQDLSNYTKEQLEKHDILWYPKENRFFMLDNNFTGFTAIGKSDMFLKMKIDKNLVDIHDRHFLPNNKEIYLWNSKTQKDVLLPLDDGHINIDPAGNLLLINSVKDKGWIMFDVGSGSYKPLGWSQESMPYFLGSDKILWISGNELWQQEIKSLKKKRLMSLQTDEIELYKPNQIYTGIGTYRLSEYLNDDETFVLIAKNKELHTSSYLVWKNKRIESVIEDTSDRIQYFSGNSKEQFFWIEDNYNKAFTIMTKSKSAKAFPIFNSNISDTASKQIKKIQVEYKGPAGEQLEASLYLPANFDARKIYPVVLSIYEQQQRFMNKFLLPTFKNSRGINARLLLESGYLVVFPDITYGEEGPGRSALLCINNLLDEIKKITYADMGEVGLMGQSFGGYETNFIASHSDRFSAFISGNSISDIIHTSYAYNYNFDGPDYWRYEEGQFRMKGSFVNNKKKYIDNNPIYSAHNIKAPMLLWAGTSDKNVDPEESKSLFNVLRKYQKPVVLLNYRNEGHSLDKDAAQKDLSFKILEWYDYFLLKKKDIPWIKKQMKDAF